MRENMIFSATNAITRFNYAAANLWNAGGSLTPHPSPVLPSFRCPKFGSFSQQRINATWGVIGERSKVLLLVQLGGKKHFEDPKILGSPLFSGQVTK